MSTDTTAFSLAPLPPRVPPLRKYWNILRISLVERLAYRADFFFTAVLRFMPLLTSFLLWNAIFTGAGDQEISGFTRRSMIAYLLLVQISRMFSSMPGLAAGIARDIRDGNLKKYLLQPIHMTPYLLAYRVAHKIAYIVTSALPYGLLFFLCRDAFTDLPDAGTWVAYFVSLVLGFILGFFFEATIGMIGFWFLEVTSFLYVVNTINFFVSGHLFPLDLLPGPWAHVLQMLPFQFLAYFPAMVFLGRKTGDELAVGLAVEAAWALAFIVLSQWLYRAGLKRYSAYGG
ncbi:MAG: ABC-2 family transporter protein [Gemmataceae bacterium]